MLDLKPLNCNEYGLFLSLGTVGDYFTDKKQNYGKFPSYPSLCDFFRKIRINYAVCIYTHVCDLLLILK